MVHQIHKLFEQLKLIPGQKMEVQKLLFSFIGRNSMHLVWFPCISCMEFRPPWSDFHPLAWKSDSSIPAWCASGYQTDDFGGAIFSPRNFIADFGPLNRAFFGRFPKNCNKIFRKEGGRGVKGPLELFWKFIRFGVATRPLLWWWWWWWWLLWLIFLAHSRFNISASKRATAITITVCNGESFMCICINELEWSASVGASSLYLWLTSS